MTGARLVADRLWEKVDKNGSAPSYAPELGPCWLWTASTDLNGYGRLFMRKGQGPRLAHRLAYTFVIGPIPTELELDHLCRVPRCVNPNHLEPVTHLENVRRGQGHGSETHCPQNHPYDEANTVILLNKRRKCRICRRAQSNKASRKRRGIAQNYPKAKEETDGN